MTKKVFNQIAEGLQEALQETKKRKRKPKPRPKPVEVFMPPARTTDEYHADCQLGIQRIGKPLDKKG